MMLTLKMLMAMLMLNMLGDVGVDDCVHVAREVYVVDDVDAEHDVGDVDAGDDGENVHA